MPSKASAITEWIKRYLKEEEPRSKSLMVSAFGDSIATLARGIWLGDLIALMAPFGVNERLVRTSAFRLIDEHWLEARREGRRSYYSLTDSGMRRFELAYGRIYTPPQQQWDGTWTVLLLPRNGDTNSDRLELRKQLEWEGFASPIHGVMLHPAANHEVLRQTLQDLDALEKTVVMRARAVEQFATEPAHKMVERYWSLSEVGKLYSRFIRRFEPLVTRVDLAAATPEQAFTVQTLLIHSYRRVTLHDPRLPGALLPADWPGLQAFKLTRQIYQLTLHQTRAHLLSAIEGISEQRLPRLGEHVRERFGGI